MLVVPQFQSTKFRLGVTEVRKGVAQVLGNRLNCFNVKIEREGKLTGSGGERNNNLINFPVIMQVLWGLQVLFLSLICITYLYTETHEGFYCFHKMCCFGALCHFS